MSGVYIRLFNGFVMFIDNLTVADRFVPFTN